ncbi:signal peptide peptidase SppA [Silanimonas sp.]|uniref:signal peptide peptidase SppA n=1 Tax=Silanimonas sp. TaxID=1929290 RepID=UPI001BC384D9|nr:signal peptide peptidase SppA [Silanimonas sp.]MBS3895987.1 signal peptide peptidase SppA [Silanimonas sp.]MBS3924894.1 signal peptide peptidase SppA [Xanthomonadaceae bacterium]
MNTSAPRPGPVRRILGGLWYGLTFTRQLVFNLLFLALVLLLLAALLRGPALAPLQPQSALVLELDGRLVEQFTRSPIDRLLAQASGDEAGAELQLRDLLRALDAAAKDPKIERVVLKTDGFSASGFAALRELGAALDAVRAADKDVIAWGVGFDQVGYYLAARADEVFMDPEGLVLIEGIGRYRPYYRELLADKLGIDVHLFRVGEFKSAAEPFVLDGSSPEAREADLHWMGDLWQRYLAEVSAARGFAEGELAALIDAFPQRLQAVEGDFARLALESRLIDATKTSEQLETLLAERGAADEEQGFRQVNLQRFLAHAGAAPAPTQAQPGIGIVVAQGVITDGKQPPGTVGGDSTSALLRQAREDASIGAVVLRVDSPGGGVYPSEQIRREVVKLQEAGKPVVVSMGNVAASGGYWISMNADAILADPSTITGSIGIFGLFMSGPRALEKIGVRTDGVGTTPLAGAFDPTRPLVPEVGTLIQAFVDHGYRQFVGKIAEARETEVAAIDAVARGRVWSGAQAKTHGLVDALGGLGDAVARARELAELDAGAAIAYVEAPLSPFQQILADMNRSAHLQGLAPMLAPAFLLLGETRSQQVVDDLAFLKDSQGRPFREVAHCFCGL